MKKLILISCILITTIINAQDSQVLLANEYFNKGDFEKSVVLYEKLAKKKENLTTIYDNYRTSLIELGEKEELRGFINKVRKVDDDSYKYEVDYLLTLDPEKEKEYNKGIGKLITTAKHNDYQLEKLAAVFNNRRLYNHSVELYLAARAERKNQFFAFSEQLASLYKFQGSTKPMIDEYINTLLKKPQEATFVENTLQAELKEKDYEYLESQLYARLSEQSFQQELGKLLVWYYIQQQDFYNAFVQSRSRDKKMELQGRELFELAELAFKNRDYANSVKIYQYLADTYSDNNYVYVRAKKHLIKAREQQVKTSYPVNEVEVRQVLDDYKELLKKTTRPNDKIEVDRNRALLYAFYLHENDSAINILNRIVRQPRINKQLLAQSKLDLGDIYLLNDEPWESTLLYSQVEKLIKDDKLGHEAKLKNAQLSFCRGDFELAQANLDVLKLATTRIIANDAMDLSLLIQDNLALDTSDAALKMYARADLLLFQKKFAAAQLTLDSLTNQFRNHSLQDEVYWLNALISKQTANYEKAEFYLKKIIDNHSEDILGDDALFELAQLYHFHLDDKEKAMELYKTLLMDYSGSIYVAESRKMYRQLRGDRLN